MDGENQLHAAFVAVLDSPEGAVLHGRMRWRTRRRVAARLVELAAAEIQPELLSFARVLPASLSDAEKLERIDARRVALLADRDLEGLARRAVAEVGR